jgi:DNA-binding NtrC family response regulator
MTMSTIQILAVGCNKPIMETIARLIDKEEKWSATMAFSMKEAIEHCLLKEFDLVLVGAGLTGDEELELKQKINHLRPNLPIVKHYGGGSGLLYAEIYQGLRKS